MADCSEELKESFEKWLLDTLKSHNDELDESIVSYLSSIMEDEDTSDEDKIESIEPILQELNQNGSFDENKMAKDVVETWNKKKAEFNESDTAKKEQNATKEPDALDTISDMLKMNALKTDYKKPTESSGFIADYGEDEEEDDGCAGLAQNNNGANVLAAQKQKKDAIAAAHARQKEQTKKAAEDQKKKEEDRKKKAKEKATKVERRK